MSLDSTKSLLVIAPRITQDPEKTFWMLILKYLSQSGWRPTVVTVRDDMPTAMVTSHWSGVEIVTLSPRTKFVDRIAETVSRARSRLTTKALSGDDGKNRGPLTHSLIRFAANALRVLVALITVPIPDKYRRHIREMVMIIDSLHEARNFNAVISLSTPFTAHTVASQFAKRAKLPWLAAVKDYFSFPPNIESESPNSPLVNWLKLRYEQWILASSNVLLPSCQDLAEHLEKLFPDIPLRKITNCYDEDDYSCCRPREIYQEQLFTTVFAGSMYNYDHGMFFEALRELAADGLINPDLFKVKFIGAESGIINAEVKRHDCGGLVQVIPRLPYAEAIAEIRMASCLLFRQKPGHFPRRTSEFIAARKPILAFPACQGTSSETVLESYGGAVIAADKEEIKATLLSWYREFQLTGTVSMPINDDLVQSFSAHNRAKELNAALEETLGAKLLTPVGNSR